MKNIIFKNQETKKPRSQYTFLFSFKGILTNPLPPPPPHPTRATPHPSASVEKGGPAATPKALQSHHTRNRCDFHDCAKCPQLVGQMTNQGNSRKSRPRSRGMISKRNGSESMQWHKRIGRATACHRCGCVWRLYQRKLVPQELVGWLVGQ